MIPNNFEYFAPKTIEEALKLVDKYGEDCKILSGGHSLIPVLKLRLAAPGVIVDIGCIEEWKTIEIDGGAIRIGGGVTHARIAADAELKRHCPLLCETASQICDQQDRRDDKRRRSE
jgi:carbon-monoxide dehydrogenase medium subunit